MKNFTKNQVADAMIAVEDQKWAKMTEAQFLLDIIFAWGRAKKEIVWKSMADAGAKSGISGIEFKEGDVFTEISIKSKTGETFRSRVFWSEYLKYHRDLKKGIIAYAN